MNRPTFNAILAQYAVKEVSGEGAVSWNKGAHCVMPSVTISGKATQTKYEGKNLFDISQLVVQSSSSAATISEVGDNYVIVSELETFTGNGYCNTGKTLRELAPKLEAGKTYVLSLITESTRKIIYTSTMSTWHAGTAKTITEDDLTSKVVVYGLDVQSGATPGDCRISNIQIEEDSAVTDYEPYTGGQPVPSPAYPSMPVFSEGVVLESSDGGTATAPQLLAIPGTDYADTWDAQTGKGVRRCAVIESYAGETINTHYISSTGELSDGAYVVYGIPDMPFKIDSQPLIQPKGSGSIIQIGGNIDACHITAKYMTHRSIHAKIYGVEWSGDGGDALVRTDDAVSFEEPVAYMAGLERYGSPFDNLLPWRDMKVSERSAGKVVSIPKFWYKITGGIGTSGTGIRIQIADKETDGFSVSPAHMDRSDGLGERDIVYVGRYHCRSSDYKSYGSSRPKVAITRSAARSAIAALGDNVWQSDFAMMFTLWLLYIVEYANWNSQAVIGYGCSSSGVSSMGYTDSMPYHTGTTQSGRETYGLGTQYRNIEGLWDNCLDWVDGAYNNSNGLNIILNPSSFSDADGGVVVGTPSGSPKSYAYKNVPGAFPLFIASDVETVDGAYTLPDNWYFGASTPCLRRGGYWEQLQIIGMFFVSSGDSTFANGATGCRLMELP